MNPVYSSISFFYDIFDLSILSIINVILENRFPRVYIGILQSIVVSSALFGNLVGRWGFGYLENRFKERKIRIYTSSVLIIGSVLSCLSFLGRQSSEILGVLIIARLLVGIGIGGEHQLNTTFSTMTSTSLKLTEFIDKTSYAAECTLPNPKMAHRSLRTSSEISLSSSRVSSLGSPSTLSRIPSHSMDFSSNEKIFPFIPWSYVNCKLIHFALLWQSVGHLTAAIVGNIVIQLFSSCAIDKLGNVTYSLSHSEMDIVWRILFGLILIPIILFLVESYHAPLEVAFKKQPYFWTTLNVRFIFQNYGKKLFGTAGSWFLFNFIFYSNSIYAVSILSIPLSGYDRSLGRVSLLYVIVCLMTLPASFGFKYSLRSIGRRNMQISGLLTLMIIYGVLGFGFFTLQRKTGSIVLLIGLVFFVSYLGPHRTIFANAVETFPVALQYPCYRIASTFGQIGAILGTFLFLPIRHEIGTAGVFLLYSWMSLLATFLTYKFLPYQDSNMIENEFLQFIERQDCDVKTKLLKSFGPSAAIDEENETHNDPL